MILYVNGDSHSAGAEAVNSFCFAEDDSQYRYLGRGPHPDNLAVSYGKILADKLGAELICDAESASSNHRIIRTTWEHLQGVQGMPVSRPDYIVIGWSTWERKEFTDPDTKITWQVNAGGIGEDWPQWLKDLYPKWVSEIDWPTEVRHAHTKIHQFHLDLKRLGIKHLFFNTYNHFNQSLGIIQQNWSGCYVEPYNPDLTYYRWCIDNGFKTVNNSYHFGPEAHRAWAEFLYQKMILKVLTEQ